VKKISLLFVLSIVVSCVFAQTKISVEEYINKYQKLAIEEMHKYKIPASIILAQGLLESGNGNSELARKANNHFGIKCKTEWTGGKYYYDDDAENECFRKYATAWDSYRDHSVFLVTREYYRSLFLLDIKDYKGWAYGLKKAGYATEPRYAEMLIKIIEENKLYTLDSGENVTIVDTLATLQTEIPVTSHKTDTLTQKTNKKPVVKENNSDDFPDIFISSKKRQALVNNGVKYIIAGKKDTYSSIAEEFGLAVFDILRYNDVKNYRSIKPGTRVYLETKMKSATEDYHIVASNETMHDISQLYAIRLKELYRKNRMKQGTEPKTGQKIWLKNSMPIY